MSKSNLKEWCSGARDMLYLLELKKEIEELKEKHPELIENKKRLDKVEQRINEIISDFKAFSIDSFEARIHRNRINIYRDYIEREEKKDKLFSLGGLEKHTEEMVEMIEKIKPKKI